MLNKVFKYLSSHFITVYDSVRLKLKPCPQWSFVWEINDNLNKQAVWLTLPAGIRILPVCSAAEMCDRRWRKKENILRKISKRKFLWPILPTRLLAGEFYHLSMRSNTVVWRLYQGLIRTALMTINSNSQTKLANIYFPPPIHCLKNTYKLYTKYLNRVLQYHRAINSNGTLEQARGKEMWDCIQQLQVNKMIQEKDK